MRQRQVPDPTLTFVESHKFDSTAVLDCEPKASGEGDGP